MVGVLIDRSPFLQRGLLPVAALASTVPLVGVAPIMVMWFGFDWHSKAAVVVVMTFFPMLVNTLAGLAAAGHMERDLMRSYGAGYWRTLLGLRIPAALPFIFNALKINSTLALIGAIVAEFFGSPVSGLGFRISTEAARLNMGLVWAAIVVAARGRLAALCGCSNGWSGAAPSGTLRSAWDDVRSANRRKATQPRSEFDAQDHRSDLAAAGGRRRRRAGEGHGAAEVAAAGPVRRLLRGRRQGLLQGRRAWT